MIRVLVVEDDFRVAKVHVAFTRRIPGFQVVGTALTAADARRMLTDEQPDLMLLDTYLPDDSGLAVLAETDVDTIMLTAASDAAAVRAALAHGALNYLLKPFTAEQFVDRLTAYSRYRTALATAAGSQLSQEDIDRAVRQLRAGDRPTAPKGQSGVTARLVAERLAALPRTARTAAEIAAELGIARATAQRYLAALEQEGAATVSLRYGTNGRPEHLYRWKGPADTNRDSGTDTGLPGG
ncbi:response regulator [Dactylosporangium darangshiense]|uniref:Transcriptional regulatory protein n=1 Tax=Dactylosporangium darangshiense TaxID=579108 RepID=A0ABP8DBQ2_9ACTN